MKFLAVFRYRIFPSQVSLEPSTSSPTVSFGLFNCLIQKRWRKPTVSAQTRLEDRVIDSKIDKLMNHLNKLKIILKIHQLMSNRRRGPFVSVQMMSRWRSIIGLNVSIGSFIHKYPHIFEVFPHPIRRNLCCRFTSKMKALIKEEEDAIEQQELEAVRRLKKLLMMSINGTLHIHALRLIRRELGLPDDFRDSILGKYIGDFRLVDLENVELVDRDEEFGVAEIERWREKEYREKWLSEFETKYAFPVNLPTGFRIERGYRDKMKNWQRLQYTKPYERKEAIRVRTCGGVERYEKRAVAIIHELLSLTVEKMVEVDQLAHFRRDFAIEVNVREVLLRHPAIFYISTIGKTQTVFLREAYSKGCLIEPSTIYNARRKMLDLVLLRNRKTKQLLACDKFRGGSDNEMCAGNEDGEKELDRVVTLFESSDHP
ncbi:hypothetical protein QN277_013440 [Acacia crassicarpa]|uniref:PORR domain-containing protein n=1 Tax=Acacia crassicarpa TaxID=499986 RepID=A0AAE1N3C4_9FABA|nr:hypothetical protein QN277_013440 [Acacia crassicarpa]